MVIKRMEDESCDILQIPVDQEASSRLITSMHVCIWFLPMFKDIEVRIPSVNFSILTLICNGRRTRVCKCC
jgi:hypothetical protein